MVLEIIIQNCKEKHAQCIAARAERLAQKKSDKQESPVQSDKGDADDQDLKKFQQLQLPDAQQNQEDYFYEADLEHDYDVSTDDDSTHARQ